MKCLVKGCENNVERHSLVICGRCYAMLASGVVCNGGHTFIHDLRDELLVLAAMMIDGCPPKEKEIDPCQTQN